MNNTINQIGQKDCSCDYHDIKKLLLLSYWHTFGLRAPIFRFVMYSIIILNFSRISICCYDHEKCGFSSFRSVIETWTSVSKIHTRISILKMTGNYEWLSYSLIEFLQELFYTLRNLYSIGMSDSCYVSIVLHADEN